MPHANDPTPGQDPDSTGAETRAMRELLESRSRLQTLVRTAPVVLFATDRDGVFTVSEGEGLNALGLQPGEVVGRSVFEVYGDHPQVVAECRRALAGESFSTIVTVGDTTFESWYEPVHNDDGQVTGLIGVAIDITARRQAEENLRQRTAELEALADVSSALAERTRELAEANEQLTELSRLKDRFVSNVSHELRTPLTNIKVYLNLLTRGRRERRADYLITLDREVDRLQHLIEDLLDLSRLDMARERGGFSPEPVDLDKVVRAALASLAAPADAARVALRYSPPDDMRPAFGNRNQLAQVVTNLVTNALHYTLPGGQVEVSLSPHGQDVCLTVADTGIGISDAERPQVFDRFFRGLWAQQHGVPGTGLGLAIVRDIVDLHGGRIGLHSEQGRGSTFEVWIPMAEGN